MGQIDVGNPPERANPRIVDEDIEPPEALYREGDHRLDLRQVHHIDREASCSRSLPNEAISAVNRVAANIGNDNARRLHRETA